MSCIHLTDLATLVLLLLFCCLSHTRSANVMTAAVYGRHSLDELQQLVVDGFSPVVDQQLPVPAFSPDVFTDDVSTHCCHTSTLQVSHKSCHPVSAVLATLTLVRASADSWRRVVPNVPRLQLPLLTKHPPPGISSVCPQHRGVLVRVVPIKESHTLEVTWDIPPTESLYRKAPTNYLSHLLGHEGAGSAFALLKARGLATALSAGVG